MNGISPVGGGAINLCHPERSAAESKDLQFCDADWELQVLRFAPDNMPVGQVSGLEGGADGQAEALARLPELLQRSVKLLGLGKAEIARAACWEQIAGDQVLLP